MPDLSYHDLWYILTFDQFISHADGKKVLTKEITAGGIIPGSRHERAAMTDADRYA
jgi:hypothetical protein